MISHTRIFDTEEEALAFADGVEFASDSSLEVENIGMYDGDETASAFGAWMVVINDYDEDDYPEEE
jgi:acyl-CoA reductase-like NAD-dependent aldehyde dehydrogenase